MKQFTKEQAIKLHESKVYEKWDSEQIVRLQLFQGKLCMPFDIFHKAIGEVLGRDVYLHEFTKPHLLKEEYFGCREQPTIEEIINQIPKEKRLIIEL